MTYEIIIKRPPVEGNTEGISPSPAGNVATQKGGSVLQTNQIGQTAKAAAIKVATQAVQSVAQVYIANKTTEINVLSGSTQLAQRQQVTNQIISTVTNVATTAASGAMMGTAIMPGIGTLGGAIVGGAGALLSEAFSKWTEYTINKDRLQIEHTAEQQEISYLLDRAGPYYSQSR